MLAHTRDAADDADGRGHRPAPELVGVMPIRNGPSPAATPAVHARVVIPPCRSPPRDGEFSTPTGADPLPWQGSNLQ
jgi:hypothetical protein